MLKCVYALTLYLAWRILRQDIRRGCIKRSEGSHFKAFNAKFCLYIVLQPLNILLERERERERERAKRVESFH